MVFDVVEVSVILMVEVFAFKVRPVIVPVSQIVPVPLSVHVPLPMVRVRVLELVEENLPAVIFLLLASNVPLVRVTVLVLLVIRLSAS